MAQYIRYSVELNGFNGAPGINTWCAMGIDLGYINNFSEQIQSFYEGMKEYLLASTKVSIQPIATVHEIGDNALAKQEAVDSWTVTGADAESPSSRATQAKLRFYTDRPLRNRMLQGGIYFGPLSDNALTGEGAIADHFKTLLTTNVGGMLDIASGLRLCVYSQPKPALKRPDGTIKYPAAAGETGYVQSVSVMPVPAVLRSRRD